MKPPERTGLNRGGYLGETIDIDHVLAEVSNLTKRNGWRSEAFLDHPQQRLIGACRPGNHGASRLYLSTGIHGDEPAGPLAGPVDAAARALVRLGYSAAQADDALRGVLASNGKQDTADLVKAALTLLAGR